MKKLKDFIYDTNDILIALIILAIAALIIVWRMNAIMGYPSKMFGTTDSEDAVTTQEVSDDTQSPSDVIDTTQGESGVVSDVTYENVDDGDDSDESTTGNAEDKQVNADASETSEEDGDDQDAEEASGSLWNSDGTLSRNVTVDIEGNSASQAANCMVEVGLFEDYKEYARVCDSNGLNPEKIAAGRFTFKKGTTKAGIVKMVNWG